MPRKDKVYSAYLCQVNTSQRRNIKWQFTFEEWVRWWNCQLGPDWFKMRGCKRGQYVMARIGDEGPYAPANVECKTCTKNLIEGNHGHKLTKEQAVEIFNSKQTQTALAKKYGIRRRAVYAIKYGETWGWATGYK